MPDQFGKLTTDITPDKAEVSDALNVKFFRGSTGVGPIEGCDEVYAQQGQTGISTVVANTPLGDPPGPGALISVVGPDGKIEGLGIFVPGSRATLPINVGGSNTATAQATFLPVLQFGDGGTIPTILASLPFDISTQTTLYNYDVGAVAPIEVGSQGSPIFNDTIGNVCALIVNGGTSDGCVAWRVRPDGTLASNHALGVDYPPQYTGYQNHIVGCYDPQTSLLVHGFVKAGNTTQSIVSIDADGKVTPYTTGLETLYAYWNICQCVGPRGIMYAAYYDSSAGSAICAFDLTKGSTAWVSNITSLNPQANKAIIDCCFTAKGYLAVLGKSTASGTPYILALLDPSTGSVVATTTFAQSDTSSRFDGFPPMQSDADGNIYFCVLDFSIGDGESGVIYKFSTTGGVLGYVTRVGISDFPDFSTDVFENMAIANGYLYVVTSDVSDNGPDKIYRIDLSLDAGTIISNAREKETLPWLVGQDPTGYWRTVVLPAGDAAWSAR